MQGFDFSTATPHGDASVSGPGVVLEGKSTPNRATVTRNIVFITSEVREVDALGRMPGHVSKHASLSRTGRTLVQDRRPG